MYCRFGVLKISAAVLLISLKIYTNLLFFLATALQNQCKTFTKWCAIQKISPAARIGPPMTFWLGGSPAHDILARRESRPRPALGGGSHCHIS